MRFFRFFRHFPHQNTPIRVETRTTTKSKLTHILTTLMHIFMIHSSLFFDKKGEFSRFQRFGIQSSAPDVLSLTLTSILDTFSMISTKRYRNDTSGPLSCRSNRKLLKKDFRSSEKFLPDLNQTSDKSSD